MKFRALLASTALATALATGAPAFAQDAITEIDAVYYVTWLEATVREAPSSQSYAIGVLYMGDRVNVTGWVDGTDWVRISFDDGSVGYMWSGLISPAVIAGPGFDDGSGGAGTGTGGGTDGPPADLAGNSIYDAYVIGQADSLDTVFEDFVGDNDLDDYYAIDLSGWTYIDLALEGLSADADLQILNEYQVSAGSSEVAGTGPEYVQQVVPAGRYYIRVTSYEGNTNYTLYVYTTPTDAPPPDTVGNSMETATPIDAPGETPQVFEERIDLSDSEDWYVFTVSEHTEVSVSLYNLQSDIDLSILDSNGNSLADSQNGSRTSEQATVVVAPGTYYVRVYVYSGQSDYTLEVSGVPSEPPPPDGAGNSRAQALDLGALDPASETGLTARDWTGPGDIDDWFAFSVADPTQLEIRLDEIVSDLDLELVDENGNIVSVSNNSGTAGEVINVAVGAGTYYAHVYAFDGSSEFALSIQGVPTTLAP
jgi:hypothetical protein